MNTLEQILASFDEGMLQRLALCAQAHGRTIAEEMVVVSEQAEFVESYQARTGEVIPLDVLEAYHLERNQVVDFEAIDRLRKIADP